MSWLLKQKERLTALPPDMSETMVHKRMIKKCGGDLENSIRSRYVEPCSKEDYIKAMEDITPRNKIGRNWYKTPIDNKTSEKQISIVNEPQDRDPFKFHKCGTFAPDNEPLGAIKRDEAEINLNLKRPYPSLLRRTAYPDSPRDREEFQTHINQFRKMGVLRKVGENEEVEFITAVIITWHNNKSRMVGDYRALNIGWWAGSPGHAIQAGHAPISPSGGVAGDSNPVGLQL
ncbi:hypothetical protein O181_088830 [Austropuccinia psidii MF-1]|uniref:Uncharacterized protein n=1 Tax=Austropuccinia psidii MF-1 TaxID=1389203 RepID=A0A9Q3ISM0_9BASI|nr:hypothetical protein [Austropuccinia psidii MF-1]